jgi:hypothetical protein
LVEFYCGNEETDRAKERAELSYMLTNWLVEPRFVKRILSPNVDVSD